VISALKDGFEERGRLLHQLSAENTMLREQIANGSYFQWPASLDATLMRH